MIKKIKRGKMHVSYMYDMRVWCVFENWTANNKIIEKEKRINESGNV